MAGRLNKLGIWSSVPLIISCFTLSAGAGGNAIAPADSEGYLNLLDHGYLPADFNQQIWDKLWTSWEKPAREKYEKASPNERRAMMFERYGFQEAPGEKDRQLPLQYTPDGKGGWVMNCFTCHGGKVNGVTLPGSPKHTSPFRHSSMTFEILSCTKANS